VTVLALILTLAADVGLNGFLSNRAQITAPSESSLLSTKDNPILADLSEANLQVKARLLDEKLRIGADVSAFFLVAGGHADADAETGALHVIEDEDASSGANAFMALSEAYASLEPFDHVVLTVGKKRTVWGPGLMFSPTDLLNPARDPTDPSLQRAGFLHARVDVPFERFTVSALLAPAVLEEQDAIPTKVLVDDDEVLHYAAALRGYALVGDADVNAWLLWTNRYQDAFEDKPRLALTLSKSLFSIHEFHAEVLLQTGSARSRVNPDCVETQAALALCAIAGSEIANDDLLTSDFVLPDILVGWRTMPDDGSMIVLEYLYQADGYLRTEYDDVTRLLAFVGRFQREGRNVPLPSVRDAGGAGVPTRVSFDPLRRHYLALSYTRPQVLDDFTLAGTLITPLEDLSMLLSGSVAWQTQEWLTLSLLGFVTMTSPARASADMSSDPWQQLYQSVDPSLRGFVPRGALVDGVPVGEFDAAPFRAQVMLEAKAFF
jgi:hypothetical protein